METTEKQHINPLGYEPVERLMMRFALPTVISMLVNALYNIVDQLFSSDGTAFYMRVTYLIYCSAS